MSMKSDFDKILKDYGHKIYLQRRSQTTDCDGVEYREELEIHLTRFSIYNNRGLPNTQTEQMEGLLNSSGRVYYFKSDVCPYEGDRIYEEDFRTPNKQTVWVIEQAVPERGNSGVVVYWAVGAGRISPN